MKTILWIKWDDHFEPHEEEETAEIADHDHLYQESVGFLVKETPQSFYICRDWDEQDITARRIRIKKSDILEIKEVKNWELLTQRK